MQAAVLFLNHNEEDPTKRRKLAGIRRYADAMRWSVVPIVRAHSRRRRLDIGIEHGKGRYAVELKMKRQFGPESLSRQNVK